MSGCQGLELGENGEQQLNGILFGGDGNSLKLDRGDGCKTL